MDAGRIREFTLPPPVGPERGPQPGGGGRQAVGGPSFGEALTNALREVDAALLQGDGQAAAYVAGESVDLHNVLLDLERADLAFRTMVQVRNKLLEAYREVMRIPV